MPDQYNQIPQYEKLDSPATTTDYSFLQYALSQKDSQYQQGASRVKNMYNSVLNSPLSNPDNIEARDQYMQGANQSMQKLSKADLSLSQNIGEAQKVFAPFYQDKDIVSDIYNTKKGQGQLQTLDSWKNSDDEKIRNQYSPTSVQDVQYSMDRIKEAKRGDGSLQKIQIQQATPVHDLTKYLDDEAKKDGFEVVNDQINGPYLKSTTNGPEAVPNFYSYAKSKIGPQFTDQFAMQGRVSKESSVRQNMQLGMDRQAAETKVAQDLYPQVVKPYMDNYHRLLFSNQENELNINKLKSDIQSAESKGQTMTPEQLNQYIQLKKNKGQYSGQISDLEDKLNDFAKPETQQKFIENSENFLGSSHKEQFLNDWATGAAANEKIKISANTGWYNQENLEIQQRTLEETARFHNMEDKWHKLEDAMKWAEFNIKYNPSGKDGKIVSNSGEFNNAGDPLTLATNFYSGLRNDANQLMFSPTGVASILTDLPTPDGKGISQSDITNFNSYIGEKLKGNNLRATPEIAQTMQKISSALSAKGIHTEKKDIEGWKDALIQYANKYVQENRYPNGDEKTRLKATSIAGIYDQVTRNINSADQFDKEHEKNINDYLQSGAYKGTPYVVNEDGKNRFIEPRDIAHNFHPIQAIDESGNKVTLNPSELAKAHMSGKLNVSYMGNTNTGGSIAGTGVPFGNSSDILTLNGKKYTTPGNVVSSDVSNLVKKYGTPEQLQSIYHDIVSKTVPQKDFWEKSTGSFGVEKEYGYEKGELGKDLVTTLGNKNNWLSIPYTKPDGSEPLNDKETLALTRLAGRDDASDYFSKPKISNTSSSGNPVGIVTINENAKEAKNNPDAALLAGKQIYVEVNPSTKSDTWKKLEPLFKGYRLHPEIAEGKPIVSNSLDKSFGYDYMITPDNLYDPKGTTTTVSYPYLNPKTGKYEDKHLSAYNRFEDQDPEKIMENLNILRSQVINNYHENIGKRKANYGTGLTLAQIESQTK